MKKGAPFEPYQGSEPYVFVSYAHKDSPQVFEVLSWLHGLKYRVWYDEGIEIGENWPRVVAERLLLSDTVLIFVSANAMRSQNCLREIHYAVSNRKKLVVVPLDDAPLPADVEMQLSVARRLPRARDAETALAGLTEVLGEELLGDGVTGYGATGLKGKDRKNPWILLSILLLLLAGGLLAFILLGRSGKLPASWLPANWLPGGWNAGTGIEREVLPAPDGGEVSVTTFKDALSMEILLASLEGEYVHLAGNSVVSDAAAICFTDGKWTIGDAQVERGIIGKLDYFANKGIRQLSLVMENLHTLSGVEALGTLEYLDLSDNPLESLAGLEALPKLETLKITHMPAGLDLAPLVACQALRTVYISYDMVSAAQPLVDAGILVVLVK